MAADKRALLRDALKQVQAGKVDKAIESYRAVIRLDPKDAAVRNSLADLLARQGKKRDAIAEYLEASTLYELDGFGPRAIAICQKIVKLDPEQWGVRLKLGDLYAGQKLVAEARAIFLQLADRHDKRGEVAAELEIFRRLAELDPANLSTRVKLGGMFEKQQRPEQAAAEYVRAARDYTSRKEIETAAQLLVRAFKLSPANVDARRLLAELYAKRQEWQVVVGLLETPVAKGGQETDLVVLYADALTRVDHASEAVALLEKLQASEPNAMPVNLVLGRAYLKTGDVEKGNAALSRCVGAHLAENRLEPAEALLREMAAAAPDDDKLLQRLVEVAHKRGDAGAAADAYLKLAAIYEKKGLVRNAVGALERYLEGRPDDAAATARLAGLKAEATPHAPAPVPPAAAFVPATPPPSPAPPASRSGAEKELEIDIEDEGDLSEFIAEDEEELVVIDEDEAAIPGEDEAEIPGEAEVAAGAAESSEPVESTVSPEIVAGAVEPEPEELVDIPVDEEEEVAAGATDLFDDLRLELESQGDLVPPPLGEAGLQEIFQEFQRSMREQLSDEDFETHYDLGIAYKEMGLTEEAIGEFSLAEKSPTRRLEAVSMIAICLREQGRLEEAEQKLRTGVALAPEGSGQQKGFLYDLAALHEQVGRPDLARETLQRLHAMDAAYRDVAARLGAAEGLSAGAPPRKSKISYI